LLEWLWSLLILLVVTAQLIRLALDVTAKESVQGLLRLGASAWGRHASKNEKMRENSVSFLAF